MTDFNFDPDGMNEALRRRAHLGVTIEAPLPPGHEEMNRRIRGLPDPVEAEPAAEPEEAHEDGEAGEDRPLIPSGDWEPGVRGVAAPKEPKGMSERIRGAVWWQRYGWDDPAA